MKKVIIGVLVSIMCLGAVVSCNNANKSEGNGSEMSGSEEREMLKLLNEGNYSLAVLDTEGEVWTYSSPRVDDLMRLIENEPQKLKGAIVADKMVGLASATLMAYSGVKEVHTNYLVKGAKEILEKAGVKYEATEEIEMVYNRDRSGQCPMDASLNEAKTAEEGYRILKERFY